jgi:hypothetical protein
LQKNVFEYFSQLHPVPLEQRQVTPHTLKYHAIHAFTAFPVRRPFFHFIQRQITTVIGRAILINYELPGNHEHVESTKGSLSFPTYFPRGVSFDSLSRHDCDCVKR